MTTNPTHKPRQLHTCQNCANIFYLAQDPAGHLCPRDKTPLNLIGDVTSNEGILHFKRYCDGCGRLQKVNPEQICPCVLCDCPTRTVLPHAVVE